MMSGGVDSSVAVLDLKEQGYDVVGVFMKCWSIQNLESLGVSESLYNCFWEEDSRDARLVADKLGIPFYVWNFEEEYKKGVVDYMLNEYKIGATPNPDVMCNSVIKFGLFYEKAKKLGADYVATGHYARVVDSHFIARGKDVNKDQTYFIWKIKKEQVSSILFPVGEYENKVDLRKRALENDLITADKPDSQGLCFIGKTSLRELLLQTLGEREGDIVCDLESAQKSDLFKNKKVKEGSKKLVFLGRHKGAYLYTVGQREKLGLAGGPWFVSEVDVVNNIVKVTHGDNQDSIFGDRLVAKSLNWLVEPESDSFECEAQIRYRQKPEKCKVIFLDEGRVEVVFENKIKAITKGQSVVFYSSNVLLGGGVIEKCD
jgi:tRNA-specific 2-thiouridylase